MASVRLSAFSTARIERLGAAEDAENFPRLGMVWVIGSKVFL
jgi:hypothetical protein